MQLSICTTHIYMYIPPSLLAGRLQPLQYDGDTILHLAARAGHIACVEHLLSSPDIDVNIEGTVS